MCKTVFKPVEQVCALKSWTWELNNILSIQDKLSILCMNEQRNVGNVTCILQKCRKEKSLKFAKIVNHLVCDNGLASLVGNYLVPTFVDCGSITNAQYVFSRLLQRNEHSWTSLILGYIGCGQSHHALSLYQKMQEDHVNPSCYTFVALLKACTRVKDVDSGRIIHVQIREKGFESNLFVSSTLVDMYAKLGLLVEAQEVFDNLPGRNAVVWTALIAGHAEHGCAEKILSCLEQMHLEDVLPDAVTFVCCLKACGVIRSIGKGRKLHAEIAQRGFQTDVSVGNTLIHMYAKCGSVLEAQEVFDRLPVQDVVAWTALIAAYIDSVREALICFEQMQLQCITPDALTFSCCLGACSMTGAIDRGKKIHAGVVQAGCERDPIVGSCLVDLYAKCGLLVESYKVFDRLPIHNVMSCNALILGYVENGFYLEALEFFLHMQEEGIPPDVLTLVCSLKACASIGAIDVGRQIHVEVIKEGFGGNILTGNMLIYMYVKCGSLEEAHEVFDKLSVRDIVSWNALIAGYAETKLGLEIVTCLDQMQLECVPPDAVTFVCSLRACSITGAIEIGRKIHSQIAQEHYKEDPRITNALVDMYTRSGSHFEAHKVFEAHPFRDVVAWTAIIAGYSEKGFAQEALHYFDKMQLEAIPSDAVLLVSCLKACNAVQAVDKARKIHAEIVQMKLGGDLFIGSALVDMYISCGSFAEAQLVFDSLPYRNVVLWNTVLTGFAEKGLGLEVLRCVQQMQLEGVFPDAVTHVCALKACNSIGALDKGREMHVMIAQQKGLIIGNPFVGNALLDMYIKCGSMTEAWEVFDRLTVRNAVSWNTLIVALSEMGSNREALRCLKQMQLEGISPSLVTCIFGLKACANVGALDSGQEIHTLILLKGFEKDILIGNTLVDMYTKCGLFLEAQLVFDKLQVRNVVSWNAMIGGYGLSYVGRTAMECFEQMQEHGAKPDETTFKCLITACSHSGLVDKGKEYFKAMKDDYGIPPTEEHYTCIVDLLSRSGILYEANKLVNSMPCSPSGETLTAFLSACKTYGEAELGHNCFEQLFERNLEILPMQVDEDTTMT